MGAGAGGLEYLPMNLAYGHEHLAEAFLACGERREADGSRRRAASIRTHLRERRHAHANAT